MLKNILKLEGVKQLTKAQQKNVKGGACCNPENDCCCKRSSPYNSGCGASCSYCWSDGIHCI